MQLRKCCIHRDKCLNDALKFTTKKPKLNVFQLNTILVSTLTDNEVDSKINDVDLTP